MSSILSSSWNFLKRHRNKALVCAGAVGGLYALNRYLQSVSNDWQNSSSRDFVSEVKKKEIHFENTIETCNQTSMSLSVKIIEILDKNLSAEQILDQIKADSESKLTENKVVLWNRLKVRIFTRVVSEVYCIVLFVAYLRVQLSILAGYIYVDNCAQNPANMMSQMQTTSTNVQNKYLNLLHNFYSDGIQQIIEPIMSAVDDALQDISLKDQIVLQDLKNVFDKVKTSMAFHLSGSQSNASRFLLNPNKMLNFESNGSSNGLNGGKDTELLHRMINETQDILESEDFKRVIDSGIDLGFAVLMDIILGCFVRIDDETSDRKTRSETNGFSNPHSIRIPLAKLLPKIWLSLQERRKPEEKLVLVRHLICLDVLNCFAANIYEAFCQQNR